MDDIPLDIPYLGDIISDIISDMEWID